MPWLRHLLQPLTKPMEIEGDCGSERGPQTIPTVKFDPSTVTRVSKQTFEEISSCLTISKRDMFDRFMTLHYVPYWQAGICTCCLQH